MAGPKIIAMWSGPRNMSTVMMRSFGARSDCQAVDEPFYAAYLAATGYDHPMREEIIAAGETDPNVVIKHCLRAGTHQTPSWLKLVYQKHMTHHMIDGFDTSWIDSVTNVFLIRSPARVLASYAAKAEHVVARDIGFARQRALFDQASTALEGHPPVLDAADIGENPEGMLRALCRELHIPYEDRMLSWTAGPKPEDGVWSKHWYEVVWNSTGFRPVVPSPEPELAPSLHAVECEVMEDFEYMHRYRLKPAVTT